MKYAIVYSSRTGNTKLLAETIHDALPAEDCIYYGAPDDAALAAGRIYTGFWTDKGTCDEQTAEFLGKLTDQEIYLFGTAGFGGGREYFDKIIAQTSALISSDASVTGSFMCQGKMPAGVRERYVKMLEEPDRFPNVQMMIDNFDRALSHPDTADLEALKKAVLTVL